jgi:amino acid transporter
VLVVLALLNARGIQIAGWLSVALLVAVLIPVAWLCLLSLLHMHHNPVVPFVPPGKPFGAVFGRGLALAMWNYAGYEQLSSMTGEMKNPQKMFVRILAWNTPMNVLTYVLPTTLAIAALGNWQEWKTDYIVTAAQRIGGPALGAAMLVAAMIGSLSLANSTILYTTRIPATMAQDGYLPGWLGRIHPRYKTPVRAIVVSAVVYCVLARYDVDDMVNIYIWTRIATTLLTLFAAWQMRRKDPDAPRSFRIPGGGWGIAYVLIFPLLLCGVKVAQSEKYVWMYAPLLLLSGPAAYALLRYGFKLVPRREISPVDS